jgi:hypothetical protein
MFLFVTTCHSSSSLLVSANISAVTLCIMTTDSVFNPASTNEASIHQFLRCCPADRLIANTGISSTSFEYLFLRYCGDGTPIQLPSHLYQLLMYFKIYPVHRNLPQLFGMVHQSAAGVRENMIHRASYLAGVINELCTTWNDRFNHPLPHVFDDMVTGSLDTFPIYVSRPTNEHAQTYLFNGKYGGHVLKVMFDCLVHILNLHLVHLDTMLMLFVCLQVQIAVDNVGVPIWYSGPHIGTDHDMRIARNYPPPVISGERFLTDKGYTCRNGPSWILAPFKKRRGETRITGPRRAYNRVSTHLHYPQML